MAKKYAPNHLYINQLNQFLIFNISRTTVDNLHTKDDKVEERKNSAHPTPKISHLRRPSDSPTLEKESVSSHCESSFSYDFMGISTDVIREFLRFCAAKVDEVVGAKFLKEYELKVSFFLLNDIIKKY